MALKECSMSKRAYKIYSKEFKIEAVRLASESDKPVTQVARELGLRVNQIYKWRKELKEKQDRAFSGKRVTQDKDAEIRRLKKALTASQEENEALKNRLCSSRSTRHEIHRNQAVS
jgi:transposase